MNTDINDTSELCLNKQEGFSEIGIKKKKILRNCIHNESYPKINQHCTYPNNKKSIVFV